MYIMPNNEITLWTDYIFCDLTAKIMLASIISSFTVP